MLIRYRNLFRYRYAFSLLLGTMVSLLFVQGLHYLQHPKVYLHRVFPNLPANHFVFDISSVEFAILGFTLISFVLVLCFIILSILYDRFRAWEHKVYRSTENAVIPIIIGHVYQDLLFVPENQTDAFIQLRKDLRKKMTLEAFFKTIVHFQELVDEDMSERLQTLIEEAGVRHRISDYLRSIRDGEVYLGLKVVRAVRDKGFREEVLHYTKSHKPTVRMEAVLTLLSISEENDLRFIVGTQTFLSSFDINRMLPLLMRRTISQELFEEVLVLDNPRLTALGVLLLRERKDSSFKEAIKTLLPSKDTFLRNAAWDYFTTMANTGDVWFMSVRYHYEERRNKALILRTLARLEPNDITLRFLDKIIAKEPISLKVLALHVLFMQHAPRFLDYLNTQDPDIELAFNEVIHILNQHEHHQL
jgi:hypothetical protein